MPTIPIRNLGKIGVITDVNPTDLPPEAVSAARNVRFSNGNITNSHVWREAFASPGGGAPMFLFGNYNAADSDILGYVSDTGKVYHITNGDEVDLTNPSYTPAATSAPITFCVLQGVYYVNQSDRVPWFKTVVETPVTYATYAATTYATLTSTTYAGLSLGLTKYANLPNWDANHTCRSLRSFKDFLVALNVTKSGTQYANMVKWSNIAQYAAVPDSWDPADLTKSAGENTLGEVQSEILDGLTLRNSFIIYAEDQVWNMEYTAGVDVFQFYKLFGDRGIVNTNCVVENDGIHYVFDADDIYMHDGVSPPRSICDKRTRNHIFRNIDLTKRSKFFVYHERAASEVWFCFSSGLPGLKWPGEDFSNCNYAAVYNYAEDTWSFHDLPNVTSMAAAKWQKATLYRDVTTLTYDGTGSAYIDTKTNNIKSTFASSVTQSTISATRITQVDSGLTPALAFSAVSELAVVPYVERQGLDLDEVVPELRAYKNYRSIYPQVTVSDPSAPFSFKFGGVDMPQQTVEWDSLQSFEATTDYKVDTRARGRYLAWYMQGTNVNSYSMSGFDLDIASLSRR